MNETNLTAEIHKLIDDKIASGVVVHVDWIATEILHTYDAIEGDDAPLYRVCTFKEVVRMAKRAIGKYDAEDTTQEQLVLPGFKHLCRAYPIERDGENVLVPVTQCTDDELLDRADQLEEMAKGCRAHARELREFVLGRAAAA